MRVENHGTICLIQPETTAERDWLHETAPEDAQWWAGALVVEPRYVEGVLTAAEGWGPLAPIESIRNPNKES